MSCPALKKCLVYFNMLYNVFKPHFKYNSVKAFTFERNTEVFIAVKRFLLPTWLFRTGASLSFLAVLVAHVRDKLSCPRAMT